MLQFGIFPVRSCAASSHLPFSKTPLTKLREPNKATARWLSSSSTSVAPWRDRCKPPRRRPATSLPKLLPASPLWTDVTTGTGGPERSTPQRTEYSTHILEKNAHIRQMVFQESHQSWAISIGCPRHTNGPQKLGCPSFQTDCTPYCRPCH